LPQLSILLTCPTLPPGDVINTSSLCSLRRVLSFGLYGLVVGGPITHFWHKFMDHLFLPPAHAPHALAAETRLVGRVALSQLVLTPPFVAVTVGALAHLTGTDTIPGPPQAAADSFRRAFAAALFTNWRWFTAARVVNQALVGRSHRVLVEHLTTLWWHTYLAVMVVPPLPTAGGAK